MCSKLWWFCVLSQWWQNMTCFRASAFEIPSIETCLLLAGEWIPLQKSMFSSDNTLFRKLLTASAAPIPVNSRCCLLWAVRSQDTTAVAKCCFYQTSGSNNTLPLGQGFSASALSAFRQDSSSQTWQLACVRCCSAQCAWSLLNGWMPVELPFFCDY